MKIMKTDARFNLKDLKDLKFKIMKVDKKLFPERFEKIAPVTHNGIITVWLL